MDGFLAREWSVFKPKPELHVIEDVFQCFPTESPEYQKQKLAELYLEMHELFEKHSQNPHLCKLRLCPASLQIKHSSKKPDG